MDDGSPDKKLETTDYDFDPSTTFLQIPVEIKDDVMAFVKKISGENEALKIKSKESEPFAQQGCFFVISLEKIEDMIRALESSMFHSDREVDKIRADVRKVIIMLQGE